jgi:hypothetical protein
MYDDDPEVKCGCLPFAIIPWEKDLPPEPRTHRHVFAEISSQLLDFLTDAVAAAKAGGDCLKPIRIMVQAEKLIDEYTREGWFMLDPLQTDLQSTILLAHRAARRELIRRALTCAAADRPYFDGILRSGKLDGPGAVEDFRAVEAHIDEGRSLYDDLRMIR